MSLRRKSIAALVLTLGLALASAPARAYPIPPQPLWKLVEKSDLVVVAEVLEVREIPVRNQGEDMDVHLAYTAVAVLRVLESWKGDENGTIEVSYLPELICPAPPDYREGEDVLAFLEWGKVGPDQEGWSTVGLSWGTMYPDRAELADFREMVRRAAAAQTKKPVPDAVQVDWLVEAAVRPGTRWHGLYPLVPESDEIHYAYDRGGENVALGRMLTAAHLERLARGFVAAPPVDPTLPMALAVLADYRSREVDEAAVSALEGLFGQRELPHWTLDALRGALRRFEGDKAEQRLARLESTFYDKDFKINEAEARAVWRTARRELGLPKAKPAQVPVRAP